MLKSKKIALALAAIMTIQPAMFAVDTELTKEIVALEVELTKMKTKAGEYANLSEAALNRKIERTKKQLEKKKAKANFIQASVAVKEMERAVKRARRIPKKFWRKR